MYKESIREMASGFVLINKRVGMTSRSVDNIVQRLFHTRKVGHLGTLDPFASGLLVIAVDKGCKSLPFIDDSFKKYRAKMKLGEQTNTGDLTGDILKVLPFNDILLDDIDKVLKTFLGESEQTPPMSSALHHDGQRLYDLSRKGIEVERKPRKIVIKSIKLLSFKKDLVEFEVICSRGTYVRTLGEDIAKALGTCGHLVELERLEIGNISLKDAKDVGEISEADLINPFNLISLKHIMIKDASLIKDIKDGKSIRLNEKEDEVLLYQNEENEPIALAVYQRKEGDIYSPVRGLW